LLVLTYALAASDMLVLKLQAKEGCNRWRDTHLLLSLVAVFWFLLPAKSSRKDF